MRFKMYKAGKIWVFSSAVLVGLAVVDETNMVMGAQINIGDTQELSATKYLVEITKENFSDFLNDDMGPIAFGVAGSTGTAVNLQQFRLDSLSFYELAENPKIHQVELEDTVMTGTGHPGDVVEVDVHDLPEIPGYNKPKGDKNGKIKVTIPENGMIDFGYTPIEAGKPGQPEQNNNGPKNTPEKGKSKGEASYPNTGSETNVLVSALGAAMLALTGLFAGLTKLRKK